MMVSLKCYMLRLGQEELLLWGPGAQIRCSLLMMTRGGVILPQCERSVTVWLKGPWETVNSLVEPFFRFYTEKAMHSQDIC
jgi:hypothetical protein